MKVDIKPDGRIHYTGMRAFSADSNPVLFSEWSDRGEWEDIELASDEVIIGFHGYIHMNWQIIHLGILSMAKGEFNK